MRQVESYFQNRKIVLATMHSKETVIQPILEKSLGLTVVVPQGLNTDKLGTFTGEVERKDDPLTTLRKKCQLAMEMTNTDLAVASEGSFGAHPSIFFAHANDELVMLMDTKHNLEVVARELTTDTNFSGSAIESEKQLREFATKALFPSHRLILRNGENKKDKLVKGIGDWETLIMCYNEIINEYGQVYAETDMRAMHNPTRKRVIAKATIQLVEKLNSRCPECHIPGFSVKQVKDGLPCMLCGQPTQSTLAHVSTCAHCHYSSERKYPNDKKQEDPMYCDHCNP